MNEIAKKDPRDLDVGPFRLTAVGLEFLDVPELDDWRRAVQFVKRCDSGVQWWLGDLVLNGERLFGEAASCEFADETWRRWAWVAEKVPYEMRRPELSFSHHEKVARLEPREQKEYLAIAVNEGLTTRELAAMLKDEKPRDDGERCPTCGAKNWDGVYRSPPNAELE